MNDIWGGDALTEWGRPFWELSIAQGQQMLERAVHSHLITSRHGAPLMIERTEMNLFIVRSRLYQAQLDPVAAEETGRLRTWLAGHD